ncbi:HU family DNA-binding protein [Carboxylicivirga sp. A043]|uniref:HU family DNA-binding protein n=1 Tax=Carboxylicivirga litoralis TaxID=2816963 RepID=UPI0021CAE786|nr:HU family DNA-binding protein [Carboxylicivirga sp. A043]MCU4155130.1 HU family DNA-binding protein [Carboxylicivirga sp. A043]
MENYILSLIKENNRVIVPNFGAFIVAKENGFSVLFNNFLSFNDGLLVDYIVEKEDISREDAEKKVDEYVKKLKQDLDDNGSYTIPGLGTFTKDATGILRFEQSSELTEESSIPEPAVEEKKSDDLLDIDNTNSEKEEIVEPAETPLTASHLNDTTPIAEFEEETEVGKETVQESTVGAKVFEPTSETKENSKEEQDPVAIANKYLEEDNSKRNRSIVVFLSLFILLPLIGFSIYFFLIKDNKPSDTKEQIAEIKQPETVDLKPAAGTIEAGPDTASQQIEKVAAIEEPQPVVEPVVNKPHQLIVGSFSNEINADKMIQKLKAKGYDQCFWFMHNNRYLVSLESFDKVYQAQARQEEILNSERMESWIITKRN